uniref:CNH domain-containing protein n=1 Tax=Meloidogyne hapla TaxID=6305 RepID=A0A1I8BUN3_MELHA
MRDRGAPVTQICCASAIGLLIIVVGERILSLVLDEELKIEELFKAKRISLNTHPTNDDPFSVQLAITNNQQKQQQILIGRISSENNYLFIKEKRLTTNFGNIVEIVFNGNCVCYATNTCYFVHNINEKNGIKLFDVADCEIPKVICSVGMEEFCVAGIQSLLMFVNGEGASTRPPLSLPGQEPPIGLSLKEPYLNVLDTAGNLFIFSIHDGSLKQRLEFPSDDESEQQSLQKQNLYQLSNIDGQTFIIPPFGGCFFELIAMTIYSQIEENILHGYLDIACSMLEEQISANFENLNELIQLKQLQQKIAINFLQKGDFPKAINLLVESEAKPIILLSLIAKQNKELFEDLNFEEFELENIEEIIPIELVKDYLLRIRMNNGDNELIECSLARIFVHLNQNNYLNKELLNTKYIWNKQKFRQFLINKNLKNLNFAAKLAFEEGKLEECFNYWKEIILFNKNEEEKIIDEEMKEMALNDCFDAFESIEDVNILKSILEWLIPINPNLCMEKIEYLENNKQIKLSTELIIELFENEEDLIFQYLDKKTINELGSTSLVHNKYIELLIQKYKQQQNNIELRNKLWNFLLFSSFYDKTKISKLFKEDQNKNEFFVERLFIKANEENSIDCLNELANIFEINEDIGALLVDAAELLCTRFPSPEMLKPLLTLHLLISKSNTTLQTKIPHLLSLLESELNNGEQVLNNLPNNLSSSELITNFLHRHISNRLNIFNWQNIYFKMANLEIKNLENLLEEKLNKKRFKLDENNFCLFCERNLLNIIGEEEFVYLPKDGQFAHLRCFRARKERALLD